MAGVLGMNGVDISDGGSGLVGLSGSCWVGDSGG